MLSRRVGMALTLAAVLAVALFARSSGRPQSSEDLRPNLLLIVVDTLRPDHLGTYGYEQPTSPEIDKLAEQGVLFGQTVSAAPWTVPATTSILTSLYPSQHGVVGYTRKGLDVLREDVTTLAEVLARKGYQTGAVVANAWLGRSQLDRGFDTYEIIRPPDPKATAMAEDWLNGRSDAPFFLYVHYMGPHGPYDKTPPPYTTLPSSQNYSQRKLTASERAMVPEYWNVPPQDDLSDYLIRYDREIQLVDSEIGKLVDKLDTLGVLNDTLVVVTADHGLEFLEHGRWDIGLNLHDENLRVPWIMSLPGKLPAGEIFDTQVRSIDIMPTVLGVMGIELEHEVQGQNLYPTIGRPGKLELDAFSESVWKDELNSVKSLRTDRFKIISRRSTPSQPGSLALYDLEADAGEQNDLLASPARTPGDRSRTVAGELRERLKARIEANRTASDLGSINRVRQLSPETVRELKKLGYIDEP